VPVSNGALVNDVHSQLNATRVHRVARATDLDELCAAIREARSEGRAVSVAGGRHAMGGQQFGTDTVLIGTTAMARILAFDAERGLVEAQAGIQWPALIGRLVEAQRGQGHQWGIVQKQTGADRLSLGGALAANVHGRGLRLKPIVGDVESFVLVGADGEPVRCSRDENAELFRLAIGGYGLFGIIASVTLRLSPRQKVQRVVELLDVRDLVAAVERRIAEGFLYGDLQFATDEHGDDFLRRGIFSCYRPVDPGTPMPAVERQLTAEDWTNLIYLSHADRRGGVDAYTAFYLASSGQLYWSDTHQLSEYVDGYHLWLDRQLGTPKATEIITEIYVPRPALPGFLDDVRDDFRQHEVELIYGTIRFVERDEETFLAWAREPYACVIFNLHTPHSPDGIERSARTFQRLIDLAIRYGGSYYLTYHRFATRAQVEACYPRFAEFLRLKRRYDPEERFQSDWYRHYRGMFADAL
jgi:FAD/FMN-containing dehydrogenase